MFKFLAFNLNILNKYTKAQKVKCTATQFKFIV